MIRGRIDLQNYGLIQDYTPTLGRWYYVVLTIPLLAAFLVIGYFYLSLQHALDTESVNPVPFIFRPSIILLLFATAAYGSFRIGSGSVKIFQEGIFIDPGFSNYRDPARRPAFIPWNEIRVIVRTPYDNGGMSIVGAKPLDEVIFPVRLHRRYDEIQDEIIHILPSTGVKLIDLRDIGSSVLGEYGSPVQGLWGLVPAVPMVVWILRTFRHDVSLAQEAMQNGLDYSVLFLPVVSGGLLLLLIVMGYKAFRMGWFTSRIAVYKDGVLIHVMGFASFARWEEIQSLEKVKPGQYKLAPVDEKMRPSILNIGKSQADDFERTMKRLGKMVG